MVNATVHHLDCRVLMAGMDEASIDSIVTDPPYELGFMGQSWDSSGIVNDVEMWRAALRVLKPGGHLAAFSHSRTYHRMVCTIEDAGFEIRDQIMWIYGSGFPKSGNLKPAHEPIVLARKPFKGTRAACVAAHRTGRLNIDRCRVEGLARSPGSTRPTSTSGVNGIYGRENRTEQAMNHRPLGRYPANIMHDGSDVVLAGFPQSESRGGQPKKQVGRTLSSIGFAMGGACQKQVRNDTGSAARFFYCAKASKADRGLGNSHPTVKPTRLMRWLCRLVTPSGGMILDPYAGSGSTGKAAVLEGFGFVGCDMHADYVKIARSRIAKEIGQ